MGSQFVIDLRTLLCAGAFAVAAVQPLEAQTASAARQSLPAPTDRDDSRITLTGCLLLGPYGDYTLSKTVAATGAIMNSVAWKIEDNKQLLGHILEKVEVTGTMLPMPDVPRPVGTSGSARPLDPPGNDIATEYRLRVKTIKKIAGDCA